MRRRPAYVKRTQVAVVIMLALTLVVESGCARSHQTTTHGALFRISNRGLAIRVAAPYELRLLRRAGANPRTLRRLASREGFGVWIGRASRAPGPCFLATVRGKFGFIECGPTKYPFPSPQLPVIDMSPLSTRHPSQRHPFVLQLVGLAADGVSRIAVRFAHGADYAVPVIANTYIARHVPQRPALMIVAIDRAGHALLKLPLRPATG